MRLVLALLWVERGIILWANTGADWELRAAVANLTKSAPFCLFQFNFLSKRHATVASLIISTGNDHFTTQGRVSMTFAIAISVLSGSTYKCTASNNTLAYMY